MSSSENVSVFRFPCGACGSLLEATPDVVGQPGTCPTCAMQFVIPAPDDALPRLPGRDVADTRPVLHAYAANGRAAPRIVHDADALRIECPRCGARCEIDANDCEACGAPFTIQSVATAPRYDGRWAGLISVVLGVFSVPLSSWWLPGLGAVVTGIAALLMVSDRGTRWMALGGIALGSVSCAMQFPGMVA